MALTPTPTAVEVNPPMGTVKDDLLNLPGEKVVQAQPAGAFTIAVSPNNIPTPVPATAITFTAASIKVALNGWRQLFVNFDPKYTGDKTLVWSVDDATKATVDQHGVVTGLVDGSTVTVTAAVKSKPTIKATATVKVGAVVDAVVTAAGAVQYSANGTSGWTTTIPATALKANTQVDYFVRVNPTGTVAADDGTYEYDFKLVASSAEDTGGAAIGGLTIINDATTKNLAKVSGKVLAAAGDNGYEITITGEIVDTKGNKKAGTALKGTWTV